MTTSPLERAFTDDRRYVWGLSYRMTGSAADADDIVQETFARALEHEPGEDRPLRPWLTRVAVNLARDQLRRRKRHGYPGPWLPTPLDDDELDRVDVPEDAPAADARYVLKETATLAFLVALEELKPQQRAVMLLRDVLGWTVRETAEALELSEPNVKTTLHRARAAMKGYDEGRVAACEGSLARAEEALGRFLQAALSGDEQALLAVLAEQVRCTSDAGGVYWAARNIVAGPKRVAALLLGILRKSPHLERAELVRVNGMPAVLATYAPVGPRQAPRVLLTVDVDASGLVRSIFTVSAPDKLTRV